MNKVSFVIQGPLTLNTIFMLYRHSEEHEICVVAPVQHSPKNMVSEIQRLMEDDKHRISLFLYDEKIVENRSYFGEFDPFGDFDLIFGASKLNLKVIEVPVRYANRKYGETQISRFLHGWLLLKMVVFAFRKLKAF